jgi:hypothetical protein
VKDRILIDELTYETSIPGVFAGGDAVGRSKATVVASVGHGKEAAGSIDRFLRGKDIKEGRAKRIKAFMDSPLQAPKARARKPAPLVEHAADLTLKWDEVDGMFTEEQAVKEAKRCLSCNSFCSHCQDFAGILADVSAGEIGSQKGFSTVIAWTPRGKEIVERAIKRGLFEVGTVNMADVKKMVDGKAARPLHEFEKTSRQRVLEWVIAHGPTTIATVSKELAIVPKQVRYEILRLVQERALEMKVAEGSREPEFAAATE